MANTKKARYLSRIKPLYIDKSREIIKHAADTQKVIDYTELAHKFFNWIEQNEGRAIVFPDEKKMMQYWVASILLRDFGIFFPRKKSNKLTEEQLEHAHTLFSNKVKLPTIADEIKVQNLEWHDLFAGFNPKFKVKKKKNKHKKLAELIDTTFLGDKILELKEAGSKIPEIVKFVNSKIESIRGVVKGVKVDNLFIQYYIYNHRDVARNKRQSKESRQEMYERITELLDQNYEHEDIANIINADFDKSLKTSSITSMIYSNGLNKHVSRKGRKRKYNPENYDQEHIQYMRDKFEEGLPIDVIATRLNENFGLEIPKHGVKTILDILEIKKGQAQCNDEEMEWLEQNSPSFISLKELEEKFNTTFNRDFDIYTILKNSTRKK